MKLLSETTKISNGSNALVKVQQLSPSTESRLACLREQYPSVMEFSKTYSPDKIGRFASFPDRCLFGTAPTLTDLRLAYEGRADIQWLVAQLTTFQENINVQQKMTASQIETCALTIAGQYNHLKASEICLFLSRLQGGAYTVDWYGAVSPDKIVQALREQFMPWRNNQFYLKEKEEEDRKREEAIHSEENITWEQYKSERETIHEDNPLNIIT